LELQLQRLARAKDANGRVAGADAALCGEIFDGRAFHFDGA
jgi:hypothetical protein